MRCAELRQRLDTIENVASTLSIPLSFADLLYTLREHINLVRKALDRHERQVPAPNTQSQTSP